MNILGYTVLEYLVLNFLFSVNQFSQYIDCGFNIARITIKNYFYNTNPMENIAQYTKISTHEKIKM